MSDLPPDPDDNGTGDWPEPADQPEVEPSHDPIPGPDDDEPQAG
jgi:hypothetical protein